jgi:hypothetical protein
MNTLVESDFDVKKPVPKLANTLEHKNFIVGGMLVIGAFYVARIYLPALQVIEWFLYIAAYGILFLKIEAMKSARGVSYKFAILQTASLFISLVFCSSNETFDDYVDLFVKSVKLAISAGIIFLMNKYSKTIDHERDSLSLGMMLAPAPFLAIGYQYFANDGLLMKGCADFFFALALYLHLVSMLALIYMTSKIAHCEDGQVDMLSAHFVIALVAYRAVTCAEAVFYNDIDGDGLYAAFAVVSMLLTLDYVYYYVQAYRSGTRMTLPT